MKYFKKIMLVITLFSVGSAHAVTMFEATDGNVNFFNLSPGSVSWDWSFFLYDAGYDLNGNVTGNVLEVPLASVVSISSESTSDYVATNILNEQLTLGGSNYFSLAVYNRTFDTWLLDPLTENIGAQSQYLMYEFDNHVTGFAEEISIMAVDINLVPVPAPAAIWLFGSAMLVLLGFARRKM